MNRNNICQIKIFANRNNIHEMKLWQIGMGIYSWPKNQRIEFWQIYSQIENYPLNTGRLIDSRVFQSRIVSKPNQTKKIYIYIEKERKKQKLCDGRAILAIRPSTRSLQSNGKRVFRNGPHRRTDIATSWVNCPKGFFSENRESWLNSKEIA